MSDFLNNAKESIQKNMPDTSGLTEGFSNAANSVRETAQNATADFSSEGVGDASQEFLNSNSIIARFVFLNLCIVLSTIFC